MLKLHELLVNFVRRYLICKNEHLTMGNTLSSNNNNVSVYDSENNSVHHHEKTNRVLFFLHRTWSIIVTEKWTSRSRIRRSRETATSSDDVNSSDYDSQFSQYSFCSCSQCQRDDGFSSGCDSILFESGSSMAPNSEESARIGQFPFVDDNVNKEKQRPPIYNPEDYALSLRKWGRKPPNGNGLALYNISTTISDTECNRSHTNSFRDYRNPMLISSGSEMMLRQFASVSELLAKLKSDLKLAYPSFVQEFVGDPLDGVTLLLDLLRAIQLSQSNNGQAPGSNNTTGKLPPSLQRKALLDELSCLQCLLNCCSRYSEAVRKLTASSAGLFTLAICIMSNVNKSRVVALQLLTRACGSDGNGHSAVSEALSTLRLRFGEPVRFRFLVGMLASTGGQGELLASGMKFINRFLGTAGSPQKRLYIQAELEQAGFDIASIKKNIAINSSSAEDIFEEMDVWEKNHIDVETLAIRVESSERENDSLRDKVLLLERRIQILQEEKGILLSLEQCLKERCSELQGEVHSLKSGNSTKNSTKITLGKKGDPNGVDDEGISSSERSITPEEDVQRESSIYEVYSVQSETRQAKNDTKTNKSLNAIDDDDEEETTIEEVIEELKNIINDAETEAYKKEEQKLEQERKKIEEAQVASKIKMRVNGHLDLDDFALDQENEIIPSNLHPQPPRKAKSLIHLFIPAEDYDYGNKEMFFENETAYTSDESSDSLLSASKCRLPRIETEITNIHETTRINDSRDKISCHKSRHNIKRTPSKASVKRSESFRHITKNHELVIPKSSYDNSYYYNTPALVSQQKEKQKTLEEFTAQRVKSKSLDRIDDGLESMVDIVVTDQKVDKIPYQFRTKSDSGNLTGTSLSRSISNIFSNTKKDSRSKFSSHSDDKQKMFLPSQRSDQGDIPYYFPRIQEKKNNATFLIKRGHGNAGMYSGQIVRENHSSLSINKEYISSSSTCRLSGKVTDLPSGLY